MQAQSDFDLNVCEAHRGPRHLGRNGSARSQSRDADGTANQWDRQFAARDLVPKPFSYRLTNCVEKQAVGELAAFNIDKSYQLSVRPAKRSDADAACAKPVAEMVNELFSKSPDGLRELVRAVMQEMLEAEITDALGAEKGERSAARLGSCRFT